MTNDQTTRAVEKPFGGFGVCGQTCWVKGSNFTVQRFWNADDNSGSKLETSILASGKLSKDFVCVIGSGERVSQFGLSIWSDVGTREKWEISKKNIEACDKSMETSNPDYGNTPELELKRYIFQVLDTSPPTAELLHFNFHGDYRWALECRFSQAIFDKIENDLMSRKIDEILIGIKWVAGLVEGHYASDAPNIWGLMTPKGGSGAEPMRGHVTSIGWKFAPR